MPYYKVEQEGKPPRLVAADTAAAALRHVAASTFTVSKPLKNTELVSLLGDGTKAEKAGEFAEAPEEQAES